MGEKTTFFTIDRQLLTSDLWLREPFTKGQAWLDLIGRANFAESERIYGKSVLTVDRGQLLTSVSELSKRWQWSEKKVRNFLTALETAKMATSSGLPQGTLITLENYDKYQNQGRAKGTPKGRGRIEAGHPEDTPYIYNNINNKKQGEEYIYTSADEMPCGISIPLKDGTVYEVSVGEVNKYQETYPKLDVKSEIKKASMWCETNPTRRHTRSGMPRFINGWLGRAKPEQKRQMSFMDIARSGDEEN